MELRELGYVWNNEEDVKDLINLVFDAWKVDNWEKAKKKYSFEFFFK